MRGGLGGGIRLNLYSFVFKILVHNANSSKYSLMCVLPC